MRENFDERLQRAWGPGTPGGPIRRLLSSDTEGTVSVVLDGELDIANVAAVDGQLREAARGSQVVVLDLRRLEFIDSSGLHLIVDTDERIRAAGGKLLVVRGPESVDRVFRVAGLDQQLEIVDQPPAPADRTPAAAGDALIPPAAVVGAPGGAVLCPSCREPIEPRDLAVEVNECYVHMRCARNGVYEEMPSPGWASREQDPGGDAAA